MRLKGFIYVIGNDESGVYKIGLSRKPPEEGRLRHLQVGSPVPLRLAVSIFVENAPQEEKRLHEKFMENRMHGEWFRLSQDDLKNIGTLIVATEKVVRKSSRPRTLSKQEARVVLTLEEQHRKRVNRTEIIGILGSSEKAADHVIGSLRSKGWIERVGWGQYTLIPFESGGMVKSKDKRTAQPAP